MTVSTLQSLAEDVESKIKHDPKAAKASLSSWWFAVWRKLLSEYIGSTLFIGMGCMACLPIAGFSSAIYGPLGFGMVLVFNVHIFGHISGAFLNPAVTLSSMILGNTSIPLGAMYIIVQCLGGITGYGLLNAAITMDFAENAVCVNMSAPGQDAMQSLGIEIATTAVLILVCCAVWDPINKEKTETVSIKFGLTIVGLALVGGPWTGCGMNPARSLGPAVWTNIWDEHWIFWVGPLLGSIIATVLYKYIFLQKSDD